MDCTCPPKHRVLLHIILTVRNKDLILRYKSGDTTTTQSHLYRARSKDAPLLMLSSQEPAPSVSPMQNFLSSPMAPARIIGSIEALCLDTTAHVRRSMSPNKPNILIGNTSIPSTWASAFHAISALDAGPSIFKSCVPTPLSSMV